MRLSFLLLAFTLTFMLQGLPTGSLAGPLGDAAMAGDAGKVKELLDSGIPADEPGVGSPLYFAAQRGQLEVVVLLLESGAEVNQTTRFGSPLQIAARGNHAEVVALLLEAGADPNLPGGEEDKAPLHDAAERGSLAAAQLLLEQGADVNQRSKKDLPPIHYAVRKGKGEMAELLRDAGAKPREVEPLSAADLNNADLEKGRLRAVECQECHALDPEMTPSGRYPAPALWNVVGRKKASVEDFPYSEAMASEEGAWSYEELNRFLADMTGYVPGTQMQIGGEPERAKRIALIAYLRTLSDNPLPIE